MLQIRHHMRSMGEAAGVPVSFCFFNYLFPYYIIYILSAQVRV